MLHIGKQAAEVLVMVPLDKLWLAIMCVFAVLVKYKACAFTIAGSDRVQGLCTECMPKHAHQDECSFLVGVMQALLATVKGGQTHSLRIAGTLSTCC